uniref:Uncharacterized protein n=1 Tax=Cacopsylla melanoneura TaxID=428564 RepID=A0A8D8W4V2_9HEMI
MPETWAMSLLQTLPEGRIAAKGCDIPEIGRSCPLKGTLYNRGTLPQLLQAESKTQASPKNRLVAKEWGSPEMFEKTQRAVPEIRALPKGQNVAKNGCDARSKIRRPLPRGRIEVKGWGGPKQWAAVKTGALSRSRGQLTMKGKRNDCQSKLRDQFVPRGIRTEDAKERPGFNDSTDHSEGGASDTDPPDAVNRFLPPEHRVKAERARSAVEYTLGGHRPAFKVCEEQRDVKNSREPWLKNAVVIVKSVVRTLRML